MTERISIPVEVIASRLDDLSEKRKELEREIDDLRSDLARIEAQMSLLEELRDEGVEGALEGGAGTQSGWPDGDLPGPTEAVDRLVEESPGISRRMIVDEALERGLDSDAEDKRAVMRTAVRRRIQQDELYEDKGERVWPSKEDWMMHRQRERSEEDELFEELDDDLPF